MEFIMTNEDKTNNIQKLDFHTIEKESIPYTVLNTFVIQNIHNHFAGFIWIYLQSLPRTWKVNKFHIMKHFDISERTYQRHMSFLAKSNLISYEIPRHENGTLGHVTLKVLNGTKFNQITHTDKNDIVDTTPPKIADRLNNEESAPVLDRHHTAKKPHSGEMADHYKDNKLHRNNNNYIKTTKEKIIKKEKNENHNTDFQYSSEEAFLINKEKEKTQTPKSQPVIKSKPEDIKGDKEMAYKETYYLSETINQQLDKGIALRQNYNLTHKDEQTFECFWNKYPKKKDKERARQLWFANGCHLIAENILEKLVEQLSHDRQYLDGYSPSAFNYISGKRWNDEIEYRHPKTHFDHKNEEWAKIPEPEDDIFGYFTGPERLFNREVC